MRDRHPSGSNGLPGSRGPDCSTIRGHFLFPLRLVLRKGQCAPASDDRLHTLYFRILPRSAREKAQPNFVYELRYVRSPRKEGTGRIAGRAVSASFVVSPLCA
jgi:hypothetical protein